MLYQRMDFHSERELEGALIRLCDDLKWLYRPPIIGDPRLPFMQKFKDELKQVATGRPGREGRGNAIYRRLMTAQQDFEGYVKSGDYIKALERINLILLTCEYEFPETWLYYPYITKAVCQIVLGRVRQALITIKPLFRHPNKDENLYGILGDIRDREGNHQAALRSYETALQFDPDDTDLCAHVLLQRIHLGKPVMEHEFLWIDDSSNRTKQDRRRLKAVQAIVLAYTNRLEEAKEVFWDLLLDADPEDIEMGHVIQCVELFAQNGQPRLAERLLNLSERLFSKHTAFVEYRAQCFLRSGDTEHALTYYRRLVTWHPDGVRYRVELAKLYWLSGRTQEAQAVCARVLKEGRLPRSPLDFYYTGLATGYWEQSSALSMIFCGPATGGRNTTVRCWPNLRSWSTLLRVL